MTDPNDNSEPAPPAPAPAPTPVPEPAPAAKARPRKVPRFQIGLNVVIQVLILFIIFLMVNYLGFRHFQRWDLSRSQKFTLSGKTLDILKNLEEPVDVIVWFDETNRIFPDVVTILTEYQIRSREKIRLEFVNPLRDPNRTRELQAKYKFNEEENVIVLDNGRNSKFVYGADMVEYQPQDPLLAQVKVAPDIKAFSGEEKLTSALQEVNSKEKPKVYFTQGHREPELEGTKDAPSRIAGAKDYLTKENIEVLPLTLMSKDDVPKDAQTIIIVGPQFDFTKRELAMLEDYWERGGHLIMFLDPNYPNRNLVEFCSRRGITPRADHVLKTSLVQQVVFVYTDVVAEFIGKHPITEALSRTTTTLKGGTQSLKFDEVVARQNDLAISPLLLAGEGYWGEKDFPVAPGEAPVCNKGTDAEAPLFLAACAEQAGGDISRRLVVVGNSALVEDKTMTSSQNLQLIIGATNWSLNRSQLLGIPPKGRNDFKINLSPTEKSRLWFFCILAVPCAAAIVGLLVWLSRRK